ncbi:hypothetical protein RJG79_00705 [Mycoplasmatota bacterium WC44]
MKKKLIIYLLAILIFVYIGYNAYSKYNNPIKEISNMEILAITVSNHEGRKSVIMNECVSPNEDINDPNLYNYELKEIVADFFKSLVVDFDNVVEGSNSVNINTYDIGVDVIYNSSLKKIYIYFSNDHDSIHMVSTSPESSVIESYDEELLSLILRNVTTETNSGFSYETEKCKD